MRSEGLDRATERELLERAHAGDKAAADRIILAHRPLVLGMLTKLKIAKSHPRYGDFFQEGVAGLLEARKRWDPAQGVRFATYAKFWVRHLIGQARLHTSHIVKPSTTRGLRQARGKLGRVSFRLRHELQREPTPEELASEIGKCTVDDVLVVRRERAINDEVLEEAFVVSDEASPAAVYEARDEQTRMARLVDRAIVRAQLSPRERVIIQRRWLERASLRRVGEEIGVSGERVRQIERSMLKRLRGALAAHEVEALEILRVA